jgi:hypothetical protein
VAADMISASDWRPQKQNTLRGFVTLQLAPSGIVLYECMLHEMPDGRRWIGLPSRPQLDQEKRQRKDPVTGKLLWTPIVKIAGKDEKARFEKAALAAIDRLLGKGCAA